MNSLLLDALACKNQGRPPIWIMRQAGRYMPAYQLIRSRYPIEEMFRKTELIVEITKLPIDLLGVDAAIVFTDILILLDILGVPWHISEGAGPVIEKPIDIGFSFNKRSAKEACGSIYQAIVELKKELKVPLIGFAGGPLTVASYLIEGKSKKDLKRTKQWLYSDPNSFKVLLDEITQATCDYLSLQIEAGVDVVQIFESFGSEIAPHPFTQMLLPELAKIVQSIPPHIPTILFSKNTHRLISHLPSLKISALSVDWTCDLSETRKKIGSKTALQGNLDPSILLTSPQTIHTEVEHILKSMQTDPGFIFNLGHGILPKTPFEHALRLVDQVKSFNSNT